MFQKLLHFFSVSLVLSCLSFTVYSQTITGVAVSLPAGATAYCSGSTAIVTFTATGFTGTPSYSIELSNAAGSFAAPTILGSTTASPVTITLPAATPSGAVYSIRVVSSPTVVTSAGSAAFTITATPAAPTVTSPVSYCVGAPATPLTAAGTAVKWYTVANGGTGTASVTPSTSAVATTPYYATQTVGGCESTTRANISVVVIGPSAPAATTAYAYCQNATTATALTATAATGNTLRWYTLATGGTFVTAAPTPSTTTATTLNYYVSQTDGTCESPRTAIAVTVNATPATPTVSSPVIYCQNATATALTATTATGTTVNWYTVASGGTASTIAPTPVITGTGSTSYYVSQAIGTCESPRATIVINVNPTPAAPAATTSYTYCQNNGATALSATVLTGNSLRWYTLATGGTFVTANPTPSTTNATTLNYYVSQITGLNCESSRTAISVLINPTPASPTVSSPVIYCQTYPATALSATTATGNTVKWYTVPTGGTASSTAPTPVTTTSGTTDYYVSQANATCESPRATISVTVNATPAAPSATTSYTYCQNGGATALSATALTGNTLRWYTLATGGTFVTANPTPSTTNATTLNYYVSQITGLNCESSRTAISVLINPTPATPTVSSPVIYCQTFPATALTAITATGTTIKWYTVASGGTASSTAPTPVTTNSGATIYYVSQANTTCESPRASITVNINPTPAAPSATNSYVYCQNNSATPLQVATAAAGNTNRWYLGGGLLASASAPTPSTTTSLTLNYSVSEVSNFGCESPKTAIAVLINPLPATAPTTATSVLLCQAQTGVGPLVATPTTGNAVRWYDANGNAIAAPTPNTSVGNTTNTTYTVTQANAFGCEFAPRTAVTTTVYVTAAPNVTASLPVIACQNQGTPALSSHVAAATSGLSLVYYGIASSGGTGSTTANVPNTASLGQTDYYVVQKNASTGCESVPRTPVTILVNAVPTAPGVTTPVNICNNAGTTALSGSFIPGGAALWYGTNATGGTPSGTATVPSSANVGNTNYYVSQLVAGCESTRAMITVTINPIPAVPSASSAVYCQYDGAPAMSASPTAGNSLKWYDGSGNYTGTSAPAPNTNVGGSTTYTYKVSQLTPSPAFCESAQATITALVNVTPAPSVSNITYCQNSNTNPLVATPSSGGTISWYSAATGSNGSGTAPIPSSANVGVTDYYVTQRLYVSGSFAGCENIPRSLIQVNINPQPAEPATTTSITYCQTYPSTQLSATGSAIKWYSAFPGSLLSSAPTPSTSNAGTTAYYVTQTNGFNCESKPNTINITVNPTPSAPPFINPVFCQNYPSSALVATPAAGNTLGWYSTISGGFSSNQSPVLPTQTPGTTYYYVSQTTSLGCESPRSTVTILVNPTPLTPPTNVSPTYCNFEIAQPLTGTPDNGATLKWYTFSLNPLASAPTVNTQIAGAGQYFVSQVNGFGCESPKTQINFFVKYLPQKPTQLITEYLLCQFDPNLTLTAGGAALRWYYPNNTASADAPVITTGNALVADYGVTQTVDGCESERTILTVKVRVTPKPVVATEPVVFCQNATVANLTATGIDIKWYNGTRPASPGATYGIFTQIPGTYDFYATQTDATTKCESDKAKVVAVIQPLPTATISGETSLTQGQSATLKIEFSGQGPWTYTLSNGFTGTATVNQNPTTVTVTPLETTIFTVSKITNNCGDGTPLGTATINVKTSTVTTGNPNTASLCAGKTFTIPYFSSDFVPSNAVFVIQISKTNVDADFKSIPTQSGISPLTATVPASTLGGNYFMRVLGTAPNISIKGQVSPVQLSVRELPNATISGPASIYENETAKITIALSGESPWTLVYSDSLAQKNTTLDLATSPYEFSLTSPKTNTYSVVSVTNACGNGLATSKYRLKVSPLLSTPISSNDNWITVFPNPVKDKVIIDFGNNAFKHVATISILDATGRLVEQHQTQKSRTELTLQNIPVGEYFLQVEQNGKVAHRKIMKIE
jgi:Ig-like domain CHU_C associated/Secretion system C-terminal sorting domain